MTPISNTTSSMLSGGQTMSELRVLTDMEIDDVAGAMKFHIEFIVWGHQVTIDYDSEPKKKQSDPRA